MGELVETRAFGREVVIPTYTCGHCSTVVAMRPDRKRERRRCLKCFNIICEKSELCRADCTPLGELARDHFEGPAASRHGRLVPAIMAGCTTVKEGLDRGLLLP